MSRRNCPYCFEEWEDDGGSLPPPPPEDEEEVEEDASPENEVPEGWLP